MKKAFPMIALLSCLAIAVILSEQPHEINFHTCAVQYQQGHDSSALQTDVHIAGRYTHRLFGPDHFVGHLTVRGYEYLKDYTLDLRADHDSSAILHYVRRKGGKTESLDWGKIYFRPDFSQFVILVFDHPKQKSAAKCWSQEHGTVICAPAIHTSDAKAVIRGFTPLPFVSYLSDRTPCTPYEKKQPDQTRPGCFPFRTS